MKKKSMLSHKSKLYSAASMLLLAGGSLLPNSPALAATTDNPAPKVSSPAVGVKIVPPQGMRYLPTQPLLVALVQMGAAESFFNMMNGPSKEDDTADAMKGMLLLMKDQIDGPLAVGMYVDKMGKPESAVAVAHLKQAALTREMLGGFVNLGGDGSGGSQKTTYKGQTLYTMSVPKSMTPASVPVSLQPTFSITDLGFLVIGTTLKAAQNAFDAGSQTTGGLSARADVTAMMKQFPPLATTDVWLMIPKPTGNFPLLNKLPAGLPAGLPLGNLPLGPAVIAIRFTPAGIRFEGLASVDRASQTAQASP